MATDENRTPPVEGSWSPRRPRTAAEQRAKAAADDGDPEVLAVQIEKTRDELAETLDAIADKVSPKRVTKRTTKKAGDAAKAGAADAADAVKQTAASATEAVKEAAATVKEKVTSAHDTDPGSAVPVGVADMAAAPTTGSLADAAETGRPVLEPVGSELPPYRPMPLPPAEPSRVPMLVAAGAAVVVALWWRRRRRR